MRLTLLFDLDDTLLSNQIETFLPSYLKVLSKHLIEFVAPDKMVPQLLSATQVMIANNTPARTLEQSFDQVFYPAIGRTKDEMRASLELFYKQVFPVLQPLTAIRPEAIRLVHWAIERGHDLVVSTNPIFPRQAILHRLSWAGLHPDEVPFRLITNYEQFHFAKPNPAFIAEILAQLGWPAQPAAVIGDSLEDDLIPAARMGLPAYWVTSQPAALPPELRPFGGCGSLQEAAAWIENLESADLRQNFTRPQSMLAVLKSTPAALDTAGRSSTFRQWYDRPAPGEWSLTEIVCHLRDVDREVNIPRLEKLSGEADPFLPGINTDRWAEERHYNQEDGPSALREFISARTRLIERLEQLPEVAWQRSARHAIFGPTNTSELVSFIVTHDQSHIQQAYATANGLA